MFSSASSPSMSPSDVFNVFLFASIFLLMVLATAVRLTPCLLVISDGLREDLIPQIILPDLYKTFVFRYTSTWNCYTLIYVSHLIHYFLSSVAKNSFNLPTLLCSVFTFFVVCKILLFSAGAAFCYCD